MIYKEYTYNNTSILALLVLVLSAGCTSRDMSDLEQQVSNIMSTPGGKLVPLPEIKPYEAYLYESGKLGDTSPFKLFYVIEEQTQIIGDSDGPVDDGLTEEMRKEIQNLTLPVIERKTGRQKIINSAIFVKR